MVTALVALVLTQTPDTESRLRAVEDWISASTPAIQAFRTQHEERMDALAARIAALEDTPAPPSSDTGAPLNDWPSIIAAIGSAITAAGIAFHAYLSKSRSDSTQKSVEEVKERQDVIAKEVAANGTNRFPATPK